MTVPSPAGQLPVRLALLASAVLLGAVCVHAWSVLRSSPPPAPVTTAVADLPGPASDPAGLHLFGRTAGDSAPVQAPPPNLGLVGVIAAQPDRPAVALLTVDGRPQALRPGDEISPGVVLREVQRDRVVVEQNGARSELLLANARAGGAPSVLQVPPLAGLAGAPGLRGQPGVGGATPFRLDVQNLGPNHLGFSKAELSRGLQDPHAAAALGRATPAASGGLALEDVPPGSLPDRIGLRSGDVLRLANGQALNNLTDLPRLYQEFGSAGEVRLEITRGGQPAILQYTMRP